MMQRFVPGAVFFVSLLAITACEDAYQEVPPPAAAVSLDDILEPLRDRPRRVETTFFGDSAWAIDYSGRLYVSKNNGYDWTQMVLPDDGHINSMQVEDGGQLGFVATKDGMLMRTADAGETWTTINLLEQVREAVNLDFGGYFDQFTFDASLENGVWIDYCQIFQTSDGGMTWKRLADDLQDKGDEERCVGNAIYDSAAGSWFADVEIVGRFLTSGSYLFRSDDDGASWQEICSLDEVGMLLKSVQSCFTLENDDDGLQAAVLALAGDMSLGDTKVQRAFTPNMDYGIFVSRSLEIPDALRGWYEQVGLIEDPTTGRIWRDNDEQLAYTDDGGKQWHVVVDAKPDNDAMDFSLGPDRGFAVYHYDRLAVSEDLGKTWQALDHDPQTIYDFAVLPEHNRIIVATDRGLSVVDAETLAWRDVTDVGDATDIVVAGAVVWTFAGDGDIHRSTDAGDSWTKLPINLEREYFYVEAASCVAEHCLLEGYESVARLTADPVDIEVIDLTDQLPDLEEYYVVKMVLDAQANRGWAVMDDGRMYAAVDGGRTWRELADLGEEIGEFSRSPGNNGFLAWGYTNRYLWSGDGSSFESRRLPTSRDAEIYGLCWVDDSIALLTAYDESKEEDIYMVSIDGGASWGPTEPVFFDDDCRIRGGLVVLHTMIARVK